MAIYTQAMLNTAVSYMVSGTYSAAVFLQVANDAARDVLNEVDLRSTKRSVALSPNLFDDVYQYTCPTTLKGIKLIDVKPQIDRGAHDYWELTTQEEFDRLKRDKRLDRYGDSVEVSRYQNWLGRNLVAFSDDDMTRKLLLSKPIDDTEVAVDPLNAVGDWAGYGDGENLTADSSNYVKGSASVNWDINADAGTTAGIYNASLDTFDITPYSSLGYAFAWVYITSATNVTNFILRIGSSASAYFSITVTTNNEGASFYAGWNLLRFNFANASETGTVDQDGCDYVALYMTKDAAKVSETDYRFDNLILKIGDHYDVVFYSKYLWQSSTGTWLENATATTDYINADAEEVGIIQEKIASYIEQYLKNYKEADRHEMRYRQKVAKYVFDNPSEALMLTTHYYNL